MKSQPLPLQTADMVALALAIACAALLFLGHRPEAAFLGATALTVLAVGSWRRARRAQTQVAELVAQRDALRLRVDHLEPLAATGLASAGLAHELKNALMVTQGFAQLAKNAAAGDSRIRGHLEIVEAQTLLLIGRLKTFVRLAAPDPEREKRPLGEVLDELVRLIAPVARLRDLQFEQELGDAMTSTRPVTDPDLRAAFLDLLLNALDHAKTRVRFEFEPGDVVRLVVEDDGPGVPDSIKAALFEPFATGRAGGLGLGLHRAKASVERDGGTLEYVEPVGGGARFVVTLPSATAW